MGHECLIQCTKCLRWIERDYSDILVGLKLYDEMKDQADSDYICEECLKKDWNTTLSACENYYPDIEFTKDNKNFITMSAKNEPVAIEYASDGLKKEENND